MPSPPAGPGQLKDLTMPNSPTFDFSDRFEAYVETEADPFRLDGSDDDEYYEDQRDPSSSRSHRLSTAHTYEEEKRMQAMAAKLRALRLNAGTPSAGSSSPLSMNEIAPPLPGGSSQMEEDPQVTQELKAMFERVEECIEIRHKYMRLSNQREVDDPRNSPDWEIYPPPPKPSYKETKDFVDHRPAGEINNAPQPKAEPTDSGSKYYHAPADVGSDFHIENVSIPKRCRRIFKLDDDCVFQVYEDEEAYQNGTPMVHVPTIKEYYLDLERITAISSDGPSKSFAYRRLQYLEAKWNIYSLVNDYQETAESKKNPHRDFYNVRKVDTHVHHSACMNQKHLLRFIKYKMKRSPNEVVIYRDNKLLTLAEVFDSLGLKAYDLSIDTLDMHAHKDTFHRFDKFNLKYNPIGESRLREIFLKTDNYIKGRYLAELTKEVVNDLEQSKYQMAEYRISIYGKDPHEWDKLAAWVVDNKLFSSNVRWLIQVPRLYDVYKAGGIVNSFSDVVTNIFKPLFEVTKDPSLNPKLYIFLQRVIGFDSVDDESKVDRRFHRKYPTPKYWDSTQNPPYSYYLYYLYANIASLNAWRKKLGYNTFVLRPHAGEAGDPEHLISAFITSYGISHGILLRKVPFVQYLFYLDHIGIAMSPLSNNALFLSYAKNPFYTYFKCGLNVSLSSDDPLQFSFTREPLIEEYSVAAQIYKLSPVDMCELARNSVLQSGFEAAVKKHWIGKKYWLRGPAGNALEKTNVPNIRMQYRLDTYLHEIKLIEQYTGVTSRLASEPEKDREVGSNDNIQ